MPKIPFNVPNPFEPIYWDATNDIREEDKSNNIAAFNASAEVVGVKASAGEVAATTAATVAVDETAAGTTSLGEAAAEIVGH